MMQHFNFFLEKIKKALFQAKNLITWPLLVFILTVGCGPREIVMAPSKAITLDQMARIAVLTYKNKSDIDKLEKWPKNANKAEKLTKTFELINNELKNRIGNVSRLNRVKIVHQSQNPTYRIQLEFRQAELNKKGCVIPYSVRVYNQADPKQDFEFSGSHRGKVKFNNDKSPGYYYWGDIMQDYLATFPFSKILENLFILDQ